MTEQEAKEILTLSDEMKEELPILKEVYEVAVNALVEIQQYRELGTVEDFKNKINDVKTLSRMYEKLNDQEVREYRKLEKYEALGTVRELKSKIEELKRWHTDHIVDGIKNEFANTSTLICHNCDHKDEYIMELEAEVEELREAREKQRAMKVLQTFDEGINQHWCSCPVCAKGLGWSSNIHFDYCPNCGQAIDWSEEK